MEVERFFDEKSFDELTNNSPEEYERLPDVEIISSFEWSQKSDKFFKSYDLVYLSELIKKSSAELLRIPNFGRKTLKEVEQFLELQNTFLVIKEVFQKTSKCLLTKKRAIRY